MSVAKFLKAKPTFLFRGTHLENACQETREMKNLRKNEYVVWFVLMTILLTNSNLLAVDAQKPRQGGTLAVGITSEFSTLNCALTQTGKDKLIIMNFYSKLVNYDWNNKWVPELAESWDISSDGLTYTFHLRKDAKWSDGKPVTSADVKFSFDKIIFPYLTAVPPTYGWANLTVSAPDDYTVVLKMKKPLDLNRYFFWLEGIQPKHIYEGKDPLTNPANLAPITNGPFKVVEYVKGDHLTAVRDENYFKKDQYGTKLPYFDRLVMKIYPDTATAMMAFEKGEIQIIPGWFPPSQFAYIKSKPGFNAGAWVDCHAVTISIIPNHRNQYLKDVRIRKAINYAVNRSELSEKVFFGLSPPAKGLQTDKGPLAANFNPNVKFYNCDPQKAKQLMAEAGYPNGFKLRYATYGTEDVQVKTAELLRSQLAAVGITLEVSVITAATWLKITTGPNPDFDMVGATMSWGPGPRFHVMKIHSSTIGSTQGWLNSFGYSNPQVDALIERYLETERVEDWHKIQETLVDQDAWNVPLVIAYQVDAWNENLVRGMSAGHSQGGPRYDAVYSVALVEPEPTRTTTQTTSMAPPSQPYEIYVGAVAVAVLIVIGAMAARRYKKKGK